MHVSYKYKNEIKVQQMEGAMQNIKQTSHNITKNICTRLPLIWSKGKEEIIAGT